MIARQQGGNIVVVSSQHAFIPIANCMAYNMSKAAIDQMARTAALELVNNRIRVNIVHPGGTDTPGERKFKTDETLHLAANQLPWGRLARPEEIARAVGFLVDEASDYITGSTFTIDAGAWLPWHDVRFNVNEMVFSITTLLSVAHSGSSSAFPASIQLAIWM